MAHNAPGIEHWHIWIITGPAGCGKSTIAKSLTTRINAPFIEGDEYHPATSVSKMASGIPLTDADRWYWLHNLRDIALTVVKQSPTSSVVVSCSALKKKYRDVLRMANIHKGVMVHFLYLSASESTLYERVNSRTGHFMKQDMVQSQFRDLEPPDETEQDCITIDVSPSAGTVLRNILVAISTGAEATDIHQELPQIAKLTYKNIFKKSNTVLINDTGATG